MRRLGGKGRAAPWSKNQPEQDDEENVPGSGGEGPICIAEQNDEEKALDEEQQSGTAEQDV